jgi:hypothetical protein
LLRPERLETPIVEDQELDAAEGAHQTRVATVAAPGQDHQTSAEYADRAPSGCRDRPCGRGRKPAAFADTGWPFDDQILRLLDPTAGDQGLEECTIETTADRHCRDAAL